METKRNQSRGGEGVTMEKTRLVMVLLLGLDRHRGGARNIKRLAASGRLFRPSIQVSNKEILRKMYDEVDMRQLASRQPGTGYPISMSFGRLGNDIKHATAIRKPASKALARLKRQT